MADRFPSPFLFNSNTSEGRALARIEYETPPFTEAQLQDILRLHPELLAVEQLEPIYSPPVCIGREVSLSGLPMDNLYVSPQGYITIVETKLWKNPGARREVVAQIIEYAKELSRITYGELDEICRRYARQYFSEAPESSLAVWVGNAVGEEVDEQEFVDSVSTCLRTGRFLLVIVGEGIRESAEDLVHHVGKTPLLGFNLNLVELGCYRLADNDYPLIIVPRVITRTAEVERAVVRIDVAPALAEGIRITAVTSEPPTGEASPAGPVTAITQSVFSERLADSAGSVQIADEAVKLLDRLRGAGMELRYQKTSVSALYRPRLEIKATFTVFFIDESGMLKLVSGVPDALERYGRPASLAHDYWARLHDLNPLFPPPPFYDTHKFSAVRLRDIATNLPAFESITMQFLKDADAYR